MDFSLENAKLLACDLANFVAHDKKFSALPSNWGARGVWGTLFGIKRTEATELIANYFMQFQGLKNYMEETVENARKNGYVKTLSGRKRILRDITSNSGLARSNAERVAINTPVQGSAADMIKLAMIAIHDELKVRSLKSKMILQVHDELVLEVKADQVDTLKPLLCEKMAGAAALSVPLIVEAGIGDNWDQAH